jgi:septation ring formation regulator EzrA
MILERNSRTEIDQVLDDFRRIQREASENGTFLDEALDEYLRLGQ